MKGNVKLRIAIVTVMYILSYKISTILGLSVILIREFFAFMGLISPIESDRESDSIKGSISYYIAFLWNFLMKKADEHLTD